MNLLKIFSQDYPSSLSICSTDTSFPWISFFSLEPTPTGLLSLYWNNSLHGLTWPPHFQIRRSTPSLHLDLRGLWEKASLLPSSINFFTWLPGRHSVYVPFLPVQLHLLSLFWFFLIIPNMKLGNPWIVTPFFLFLYLFSGHLNLIIYDLYAQVIPQFFSSAQATSLNPSQISTCLLDMTTWMLKAISKLVCSKTDP